MWSRPTRLLWRRASDLDGLPTSTRRDEASKAAAAFATEFCLPAERDPAAAAVAPEAFRDRFVAHGVPNYRHVVEGISLMAAAQRELARAAYEVL